MKAHTLLPHNPKRHQTTQYFILTTLILGFGILGCGGLDEDPCTFQEGEKVTVTSRFDGFADYFRITRKCSENSILKVNSIRVYLVIKDDKIYTKGGDKITLEIIEKASNLFWDNAYYVKVVAHEGRF